MLNNLNRRNISTWLLCFLLTLSGTSDMPLYAQSQAVSSDRLAWTQAAGVEEISQLSFAIFVDGSRQTLAGVTCLPSGVAGSYECQAPFPAMTPGAHAIELMSIRTIGGLTLESTKSAVLQVQFVVVPAAPTGLRIVR
jgi:hypothetical protein